MLWALNTLKLIEKGDCDLKLQVKPLKGDRNDISIHDVGSSHLKVIEMMRMRCNEQLWVVMEWAT